MHSWPANDNERDDDNLYRAAVEEVRRSRKASISHIQIRLQIGFNAASRLIERMEREGIVTGPR